MHSMKTFLSWFFSAALVFCLNAPCWAIDVGKPAPALTAVLLDGDSFSLADEIGHVVIINFWAAWCAPCREEMPALDAYYRLHKAEGLKLIAISMDDPNDEAVVKKIMSQYSFPVALKLQSQYKGFGRIWHMPMTFIVDRQGIVRQNGSVGDPKVDLSTLDKIVTPLLKLKADRS